MTKVVIIDYKMSNMFSLKNAINSLGLKCEITNNKNVLLDSDIAILPGVGAFPEAMNRLQNLELIDPIYDFISSSKPFLGICLGMHLLLESSEEFFITKGLGLINGRTKKFTSQDSSLIVPHVGWNEVKLKNNSKFFHLFNKKKFYFVHSYFPTNILHNNVLMYTEYSGVIFPSMIIKNNIIACQFHPEKSGIQGLHLLKKMLLI